MPPKPTLQPGDFFGIVSPASGVKEPDELDHSIEYIQKLGYKVRLGKFARSRYNSFLAAKDIERARDLISFLKAPDLNVVHIARGGYGILRLLQDLEKNITVFPRKLIIGYSDITILHLYMQKFRNAVTYHGPNFDTLFKENEGKEFRVEMLFRAISGKHNRWSICAEYPYKEGINVIRKGKAKGKLIGGNLVNVCSLIGTKYAMKGKGKIIFLEEIHEPPYKIDRMLTQLIATGAFEGALGFAFGIFTGCDSKTEPGVLEVIAERLSKFKVPILFNLPFGHTEFNATLPVGGEGEINTSKSELFVSR